MATMRHCIIHIQGTSREKKARSDVLAFSELTWNSVQAAAAKRQSKPQFTKSLYHEVVLALPQSPCENDGYHVSCYRKFTAVTGSLDNEDAEDNESHGPHLRCSFKTGDTAVPSTSGIFPHTCLFCKNTRKKKKGGAVELLGSCETLEAGKRIQEAAVILQDANILSKVAGIDLVAKEAKYHHTCKSSYLLAASRMTTSEIVTPELTKSVAVRNIHEYIENSVLADKRPELSTSIYERYCDFCCTTDETPMLKSSLNRNIIAHFGNKIKMQSPVGKKLGCIIYNSEIEEEAVRDAFDYSESSDRLLTKPALFLRKELLNAPKKEIPQNPTLNDVKDGDTEIPQQVLKFFRVMYTGKINEDCGKCIQRRVESTSQDTLFIVQRGKAKTKKHVTLGMAIKSITGSKKLVQVFNRFGHCLNYSSLEELETATAEATLERKQACPEDTIQGYPIGLAFDNFDEFTQTLSGSGTLHDTMGILYQNMPSSPSERIPIHSSGNQAIPDEITRETKKKRSLTVADEPLVPYVGSPKVRHFSYNDTNVFTLPDCTSKARQLDLVWMMNHALGTRLIPMWVGFNARNYSDSLPKQEVRYMPNIKEPITSLSVIRETLLITQRCATECDQKYGIVSYDLNAAKPAMQIQATEKPRFDNVFVMLGAFHVEMAFFKALGKLVTESGGGDILTETGVLAPGSLNGFLTGKHFNRCKRIHPLLALAFEILHFNGFQETYERKEELDILIANGSLDDLEDVMKNELFQHCITQYNAYTESTRSGSHGSTAQFWMMYVDYIRVFHNLERAIRTNDIALFISTMTPVIGLFFATAHINYSRWLTKYQLDLLNMDDTHPGLRDTLSKGVFTVRRTDHDFSRCAVDLTLEQTINADAASRLTGITAFTNDYYARLRWMITKSTRASFISLIQEMAGLISKEDVTSELRERRIRRDNEDLQKIMKQIQDTNNPLLCIGRSVQHKHWQGDKSRNMPKST